MCNVFLICESLMDEYLVSAAVAIYLVAINVY